MRVLLAQSGGAIPLLEEGLQFSRTLGFQNFVPTIGNVLAEARAQVGRFAEAEALLDGLPRGRNLSSRSLALLLLGRLADARGLAVEALPGTRERGERGDEAWFLWLLGEIAARESPCDADSAVARFRDALSLADVLPMRPLAAHCHTSLGKMARRAGEDEDAHEHLTTATTMYREMDVRFWLEQAKAELRRP